MNILKIKKIIKNEHDIIEHFVASNNVSMIISDNRYGAFSKKVKSVFITHQLEIQTGLGKMFNKIIQYCHYKLMKLFAEIWVPDVENIEQSLSGILSHTKLPKKQVCYIGPLSRMEPIEKISELYKFAFVISGPEPYRTIFLKEALSIACKTTWPIAIITGNIKNTETLKVDNKNVFIYNHIPAIELNRIMLSSAYIICRSGYSSIMDLAALQKKAILIPTPGQTEQQYLATYVNKKKYAMQKSSLTNETIETLLTKITEFQFEKWPEVSPLNLPIEM